MFSDAVVRLWRENAIFVLSGAAVGPGSKESAPDTGPAVKRVRPVPFGLSDQMEPPPETASLLPSGDQARSLYVAPVVSWMTFEPSAFMTKMSFNGEAPWSLMNAIFVPSGDQVGEVSEGNRVLVRLV